MFGKVFGSMYEGSLVGKGALTFAVMGYAIARAHPVKDKMQVTLNPTIIAASLGESVPDVIQTIEFLCSPDPDSTTKAEDGRRLVRLGAFEYWLVNGMKYRAIRDEEQRREQVRTAVARHREKKKRRTPRLAGQLQADKMERNGAAREEVEKHAERITDEITRDLGYDPDEGPL